MISFLTAKQNLFSKPHHEKNEHIRGHCQVQKSAVDEEQLPSEDRFQLKQSKTYLKDRQICGVSKDVERDNSCQRLENPIV